MVRNPSVGEHSQPSLLRQDHPKGSILRQELHIFRRGSFFPEVATAGFVDIASRSRQPPGIVNQRVREFAVDERGTPCRNVAFRLGARVSFRTLA